MLTPGLLGFVLDEALTVDSGAVYIYNIYIIYIIYLNVWSQREWLEI